MSASGALDGFLAAAAATLLDHDSAIARRLAAALERKPRRPGTAAPAEQPACKLLDGILPPPGHAGPGLLAGIAALRGDLAWRRAGGGRLPAGLNARLAVTEILGPDGMIAETDCRFGLLLLAPDTAYPAHSHEAEELYHVLAGTSEWSLSGGPFARRPPGSFVHHPPRQSHAMRTRAEPLLALWGWTGEIGLESYRLDPAAQA